MDIPTIVYRLVGFISNNFAAEADVISRPTNNPINIISHPFLFRLYRLLL